jgi:formylglycine-generating enzyme required for sulfatase activity
VSYSTRLGTVGTEQDQVQNRITDSRRITRGGAYQAQTIHTRSASRSTGRAETQYLSVGFRITRTLR